LDLSFPLVFFFADVDVAVVGAAADFNVMISSFVE
jgi:hypothetical protein